MTAKSIFRAAALCLVTVAGTGGFLWLNRDTPRIKARIEILTLKRRGVLPEESWTDILRRIAFGGGRLPGLRMDVRSLDAGHISQGGILYNQHCAGCHGDSDGGGPVGVDLASSYIQRGMSDLDIYTTLTRGKYGTGMPAVRDSPDEGMDIVAYVRSIGRATSDSVKPPCSACQGIQLTARNIAENFSSSKEWLSYSGDYTGQRFAPYTQIHSGNVAKLRPRFVFQTKSDTGLEAVPIVVNGVILLTGRENEVIAVDLETGAQLWEYRRSVASDLRLCCRRPNRGVAVLGNRVFHGTLDGRLVALDIRDGKELWNIEAVDYRQGYSMTGAPLAIDDRIIVGVAGGDFGAIGVVDAYDPETGKRLWRFETVPGPGQPGHDSWKNDAWKSGGGATWVTGAYDPQLGLIYWGTGNPAKVFNPSQRPGDNLYTSSVVALDAKTGALRWHYQFTPNDGNDWDATQTPVLVDAAYPGSSGKLMLWGNRNCFFYVLDRETGKFLRAAPFCPQNWNEGFTSEGRPLRRPTSVTSANTELVMPGITGGANWMPSAYDRSSGTFFVKNYHGGTRVLSVDAPDDEMGGRFEKGDGPGKSSHLTAIRAMTGEALWEISQGPGENGSGILTSASGLLFTGDNNGRLVAIDSASGKEIWAYRMGGQMSMAPITFLNHGVQEIAVISGGSLFVLALP